MSKRNFRLASTAFLLLPLMTNAAQPSHGCAVVQDDAQRLACYDTTFGKPATTVPSLPAAVRPAPSAPAAVVTAPAPAAPPAVASKHARPEMVTSAITGVQRRGDGRFVATLANGQVWGQLEAFPKVELAVGDAVKIRPAALGSYILAAPSGLSARVRLVE